MLGDFLLFWLLIVIIFACVFILLEASKKKENTAVGIDVHKLYHQWKIKSYFFSKPELFFYRELLQYLADKEVLVFPKVRIADLAEVKHQLNRSDFMKTFLKLSQKHVDYVITDTRWKILCVIELDGKSHSYWKTLENDKFKKQFFQDIWLPLLRFQNYSKHNLSQLDLLVNT